MPKVAELQHSAQLAALRAHNQKQRENTARGEGAVCGFICGVVVVIVAGLILDGLAWLVGLVGG
jgi:hypothetical protein